MDVARGEGARIVCGGARHDCDPNGYFVQPTLFGGATPAMRIAREEIFGPVLTAIPFDDEDGCGAQGQRRRLRACRLCLDQ